MKPLSIALVLPWLNDGTHKNHVGDHDVAMSWQKYLRRREDVATVTIFGERVHDSVVALHEVVIHFWPWSRPVPDRKNILYLQSALSAKDFGVDTVGAFREVKGRFDGHMFVSETLRAKCGADGAVIPFASDPEVFTYQPDDRFAHPVCFVGNDIRPAEVNERYMIPTIPHGLVIYGGPWKDPRLEACRRGRLPAESLPKVYSSARVNINITHPEHAANGVVNQRVYDILACGGTVNSDLMPDDADLGEFVYFSSGYKPFSAFIGNPRDTILAKHTVAHRVADVMAYLKEIM